jgi:putative transposase
MKYLSTGNAVFSLSYYLVIITKNRQNVLNNEMTEDIKEIVTNILVKNNSSILKFTGEQNCIYIAFETPPTVFLPSLVNSIKTVSSRILRKKYQLPSLTKNKSTLWDSSYFIVSFGEIKSNDIQKYLKNQGNKFTPPLS